MKKPGPQSKVGGLFDLQSWHTKPADFSHLFSGLDGIRGLAILAVVASHILPFVFAALGGAGVRLFFVLSGFFGFPIAFIFSACLHRFFSLPILRWAYRRKS